MRLTKHYCEVLNLARKAFNIHVLIIKNGEKSYKLVMPKNMEVIDYNLDLLILKIGSLNEIKSFLEGMRYEQLRCK